MSSNASIDLNSDLGEGYGPWSMGDDATMLTLVSSANVACGGHASDPETMFRTLSLAKANGIVVGAHPSYPDIMGFGRRRLPCSAAEIERFVAAQVGALMGVAALVGVEVRYVKPHGMLCNVAADEPEVAGAIAAATRAISKDLAILGISGTELELKPRAMGLPVFSELYADRGYTPQGRLVPRGQPGAMIEDPDAAARRLLNWLQTGRMRTHDGQEIALSGESVCIHGDSAHAVAMARHLRGAFTAHGVEIRPFMT